MQGFHELETPKRTTQFVHCLFRYSLCIIEITLYVLYTDNPEVVLGDRVCCLIPFLVLMSFFKTCYVQCVTALKDDLMVLKSNH